MAPDRPLRTLWPTRCGAAVLGTFFLGTASPAFATPAAGTLAVRQSGLWEIVGHADPIVKGVMLLLVAASIATWALWFTKLGQLRTARRALEQDISALGAARSFQGSPSFAYAATMDMAGIASAEVAQAGSRPSQRAVEGIEERFAAQVPMVEARATHTMLRGTNLIASIGATAPFVGLAGTVWGIMNSFLGIAASKSTSLAVVAPGIAEALLATAMGLAVAIPAVLIYNGLARSIASYKRLLNEMAVLASCVLSRDLEYRQGESAGDDGVVVGGRGNGAAQGGVGLSHAGPGGR